MIRNNRAPDDYRPTSPWPKRSACRARPSSAPCRTSWTWTNGCACSPALAVRHRRCLHPGNPHNLNFYVRPADQRVLALRTTGISFLPLDPSAPLWGNQKPFQDHQPPRQHALLPRALARPDRNDLQLPAISRLGLRITARWRRGLPLRPRAGSRRSQYVRSRLPAAVRSPSPATAAPSFTVTNLLGPTRRPAPGLMSARFASRPSTPLPLTWLDASRWQVAIRWPPAPTVSPSKRANRRGEIGRPGHDHRQHNGNG